MTLAILYSLFANTQTNKITVYAPVINTITGIAGSGGFSGNGGFAKLAQIGGASDIAVDSKGNKYIADGYTIRRIDAVTGTITHFAGNSANLPITSPSATPSNNIPRTSAMFKAPVALAIDNQDNVYVADMDFHVVQKIDVLTNQISIYAGNVNGVCACSTNPLGDGGAATAAYLWSPQALVFDNANNLYIVDYDNYRVRVVGASGSHIINTIAGNGNSTYYGNGVAANTASFSSITDVAISGSFLYISDDLDQKIRRVNLETLMIYDYAFAGEPEAMAFDNNGNLFVANGSNNNVIEISNTLNTTTVVNNFTTATDDGEIALTADLTYAQAVEFDKCGNLYISDWNSSRVRVVHFNNAGTITHPAKGTFLNKITLDVKDLNSTMSYPSERLLVNGNYYWAPINSANNYKVTPTKPYIPNTTTVAQATNGINATDVLFIKRHILTTTLFNDPIFYKDPSNSPYRCIAADVDNNGVVNTSDFMRINRLILGTDKTFPNNKMYSFIDKNSTFSNPINPFNVGNAIKYNSPFIDLNNLNSCTPSGVDFYWVKLGDVSWSWNPLIGKASPIQFYFNDIDATELENITIPVRVNNFTNISAVQFSLSFDPTHFEYNNFENDQLPFEINSTQANTENNNGVMSFIWVNDASDGVTLSDGSVLFYLTLHKKKSLKTDDIVLTSDLTKVEAINNDFELIPITKKKCKIIDNSAGSIEEYRDAWDILPNYNIMGNLLIKAVSRENKTVTVQVYDKDERLVFETNRSLREGENMLFTNLRTKNYLQQGIYYVKLVGMEDAESKPLFIGDIDEYATPDDIANGDISSVATSNTELALYSLQTQLYKQLMANPSLVNTTALENFVTRYSETNIDKIYRIEYALTDGENASAASQIESFTAANTIDANYKNYYSWVLKLLSNQEFSTSDESNLNLLVVQCPLTAGMVVHNSRDLSNYLTEDNTIFGDVCPVNNTASRSLNNYVYKPTIITPKPIIRNKQLSNSLISVYPNPTKGLVHISIPRDEKGLWNITVQDVLGRVLQQQTTTAFTKSMDIIVSSNTGFYYITMTNKTTNKKFVEKVIVE